MDLIKLFKGLKMLAIFFATVTATIVLTLYLSTKLDKSINSIFILLIFFYIMSMTSLLQFIEKTSNDIEYTRFRDKKYPDFSKSKKYQHWLIDHPKNK